MAAKTPRPQEDPTPRKGYLPDTERRVLGYFLLEPNEVTRVLDAVPLTAECFSGAHEYIFLAIQEQHAHQLPADGWAIAELFEGDDAHAIRSLMTDATTVFASDILYHASRIADAAYERLSAQAFMQAAGRAINGDINGADAWLKERLASLALYQGSVTERFWDIDDILAQPDPEWVLGGILQEQTSVALVADGGTGKTWLAWDWVLHAALGRAWLGRSMKQGHSFYFAGEGKGGVKTRLAGWLELQKVPATSIKPYVHFDPKVPQLLENEQVDQVLARIRATVPSDEPIRFIIIDTVSTALGGGDISEHKDMSPFIRSANRLKNETGATVILITHTNKAGGFMGSSAIKDDTDCTIMMRRNPDDFDQIELSCPKQREAPEFETFCYGFKKIYTNEQATRSIRLIFSLETLPSTPPLRETHHAVQALQAIISHPDGAQGVSATQWKQLANLSGGTWDRTKAQLLTDGYVVKQSGKFGKYVVTDTGIEWFANRPLENAPEHTNSLAGAFSVENAPENTPDPQTLWDEE